MEINIGKEQQSTQWALNLSLGYGANRKYITPDSDETLEGTKYFIIHIWDDTEFSSLYDADEDITDFVSSLEFTQGMVLYGEFSKVKLSSGKVVLFEDSKVV